MLEGLLRATRSIGSPSHVRVDGGDLGINPPVGVHVEDPGEWADHVGNCRVTRMSPFAWRSPCEYDSRSLPSLLPCANDMAQAVKIWRYLKRRSVVGSNFSAMSWILWTVLFFCTSFRTSLRTV